MWEGEEGQSLVPEQRQDQCQDQWPQLLAYIGMLLASS